MQHSVVSSMPAEVLWQWASTSCEPMDDGRSASYSLWFRRFFEIHSIKNIPCDSVECTHTAQRIKTWSKFSASTFLYGVCINLFCFEKHKSGHVSVSGDIHAKQPEYGKRLPGALLADNIVAQRGLLIDNSFIFINRQRRPCAFMCTRRALSFFLVSRDDKVHILIYEIRCVCDACVCGAYGYLVSWKLCMLVWHRSCWSVSLMAGCHEKMNVCQRSQ